MLRSKRSAMALAVSCAVALSLGACAKTEEAPQPSWSIQAIAELTTTECYYHNVAKLSHDADNFTGMGYKKMWLEYAGTVDMGIDASKVKISGPDADGVVTIEIPQATVLGEPDVDESTITPDPLTEVGPFTVITPEEKAQMFSDAQQNMKDAAQNDSALLYQAKTRAQEILEQYVKNMGEQLGQTYTVKFVDAE